MVTDIRAVGDCTEIAITKWAGKKKKKRFFIFCCFYHRVVL